MVNERAVTRAIGELQRLSDSDVLADADTLRVYGGNFGGLCERTPALVVRPHNQSDLLAALRIAVQTELTITTRGAGHCQSNLGLGTGIVLDMTRLNRVLCVDVQRATVEVEAGATWRDVIDATFPLGLLPVGLGQIVDTTVAGTLSVGGIGGQSFHCGPQVDNVRYVDVATLDGKVVRCSPEAHVELFEAVLAGLGQCGVLLRVGYAVRACSNRIVTRGLAYRDTSRFLQDATAFAAEGDAGRWLIGMLTADPFDSRRRALMLWVGQEQCDSAPDGPTQHADFELRSSEAPLWDAGRAPGHPFFHSFNDQRSGASGAGARHPWVERLGSREYVRQVLETLLDRNALALGSGSAGVRFVRRGPNRAPLFIAPSDQLVYGIGAFASFTHEQRDEAEASARNAAKQLELLGGKRYLSGYLSYKSSQWAEHYGEVWARFCQAKHLYDPDNRLNPGFVEWPGRT